ncbi:MAG: hypothetical protein CMJ94_05070 [Planctomycetes bacterium]|nr:hypothetical protein [Planctomycetota bacterium]
MDTLERLFGWQSALPEAELRSLLLSLTLAFVLGQMVAWVYQRTHSGLSYARSFTQSLVLLMMIVSLVMHVIGDSIVTAFGLIGALAIIRFRNVLKDTRDTVFVFYALVLGLAIGSGRFAAAIVATLCLLGATVYLAWVRFGTRGFFDGHLSFRVEGPRAEEGGFQAVMRRHCRRFESLSVRQGDAVTEFIFQVRMRDRRRGEELVAAMRGLGRVDDVSLVLQDELAEI